MTAPSGAARQILDTDVIVIDLDGISYLTSIVAAEYAIDENTHVKLLKKWNGRLVTSGLLFPARTGKTIYAHVGHRRHRMAAWQFTKVLQGPGHLAPALYCVPSLEVMC
jgi:hypothetical protein